MKTNENSFEDVIKKSSSRKNILFDFKKTWIAYLIFIVLVIVSFVVQSTVQNSVNQGLEAEFEKSYSSIITRLDNQYDRLFQVVNSTQGVYYQNVQVVRDIFELNGAVPVKNYSSIICMTYAPKVTQSYFPEFHYNALSEGYNNYDLHPNETRDYYYPVEHIVKYEDNLSRLAFDYASLPIMKTAIELAQSENQIVSTEFFNLRPDTLSFAIIAPIFQKGTDYSTPQARKINFKGSVVLEINSNIYFDAALKGAEDMEMTTAFPTDTQVVFSIIDKSSQGAENTVFKSSNYSIIENGNYTPTLSSAIELKIANRTLTINFATIPGFGSMQANLPIIALIVSLLLSILAFVLIIVLLTQKAKAEEIAEKMTESQRRILDTSRDIIAVASADGTWLSMNPTSITLLGKQPNEVIGTKITDYFYEQEDMKIWSDIVSSKIDNQRQTIKIKSNNSNGFIWISWSFTTPANENLVYAIGRDVTLEREAEDEIKLRSKQIELANSFAQEADTSKIHLMIQLSHEMRNQLTSMMGYLQLITSNAFDNDDELQTFAGSAYESAESAFTYIHDISEATIGDNDTISKVVIHKLEDTINPIIDKFKKEHKSLLNIKYADNSKDSHIIVDDNLLVSIWEKLFRILTISNPKNTINITANENNLEGVTEIIIEAESFSQLAQLISTYNASPTKVVDNLRLDYNDILLDIAKISSCIKQMMGVFNIESMDDGKTAYIFITLPLVLKIQAND